MARQWIRKCSLVLDGGSGQLDVSNMRIKFQTKMKAVQWPNNMTARVYNLSKETAKRIVEKEFDKVELKAGYEENFGTIFKGTLVQAFSGRESPTETYVDLFCGDGEDAHNWAVVNKTLPAGSSHKDVFETALKAMEPFGIKRGFVTDRLAKTIFPRAYPMFGMARDYLRVIAKSEDAQWSIQMGELDMVHKSESKPGGAIKMNSETGMIGQPVETSMGIIVTCLLNPALRVNQLLQIDEASIQRAPWDLSYQNAKNNSIVMRPGIDADGLYQIMFIDTDGDTRGNPWYCTAYCKAKSGAIPAGAIPRYLDGDGNPVGGDDSETEPRSGKS